MKTLSALVFASVLSVSSVAQAFTTFYQDLPNARACQDKARQNGYILRSVEQLNVPSRWVRCHFMVRPDKRFGSPRKTWGTRSR